MPHPHAIPRQQRGKAADAARRAMLEGMQVHSVAVRMGLAPRPPKPGEEQRSPRGKSSSPATSRPASPMGGMGGKGASANAKAVEGMLKRRSTISERAGMIMAGEADAVYSPGAMAGVQDEQGSRFLDALAELQAAKRVLDES